MTLSSHVYSTVLCLLRSLFFYQNLVEGLWHKGLVHIFVDLYLIISILILLQMLIVKKKKNSRSSSSLLVYLLTPTYLLLILQSCLIQL